MGKRKQKQYLVKAKTCALHMYHHIWIMSPS